MTTLYGLDGGAAKAVGSGRGAPRPGAVTAAEKVLAAGGARIKIKPHGREIDDDSLARRIRQQMLRGQDDLASLAGQPRIDSRVCPYELLVAHVEAAREVGERVFVVGAGDSQLANHVRAAVVELEAMRAQRIRLVEHEFRRWRQRLEHLSRGDGTASCQQAEDGQRAEATRTVEERPHGREDYSRTGRFGCSLRSPGALGK